MRGARATARAAAFVVALGWGLVVPGPGDALELACGTVHDSLAVGELDSYELTAAPGSVLMVAVGEPTGLAGFDPAFTLTDGNDAVLASCSGPNACNATATLTGPAPHTLKVFDEGLDSENDYNLSVVPLSDAFGAQPACAVPLGCDATTPITDSLARGELHSYVVAAEVGTVVMIGIAESVDFFDFDPTFMLTDGTGAVLATCTNASGCNDTATLSGAPPFLLTVFDVGSNSSNSYNLSLAPLSGGFDSTACMVSIACDTQTPITASLKEGEIDSYLVDAEPGSTLMIGVGETTLQGGFNPTFKLSDGNGTELTSCSAPNGCNDTVTLTGPPPYTVTVFDQGSDWSHGYNLSVVPLSDAFPQTACMQSLGCDSQAPATALLARGEIDSYRLTAQPQSIVMLAIAEPDPFDGFDPTVTLTDTDGNELASCSAATGCNEIATLSGSAPYTVTVFDVGSDSEASYNLTVAPLSDAFPSQSDCTVAVGCNAELPLTGSLAKGDLASYRLTAHAGDVVTVEVAETPPVFGFDPAFVLTDGDGIHLISCSGTNGCTESATLSGPSPFTITVYDVGSDSANGYRVSPSISPCGPTTTTPTLSTTTTIAQPQCSLPVTAGPTPKASDCLFILGAAVGSRTCTPQCICDTNADSAISASDALRCLRAAVGQPVTIDCPC